MKVTAGFAGCSIKTSWRKREVTLIQKRRQGSERWGEGCAAEHIR